MTMWGVFSAGNNTPDALFLYEDNAQEFAKKYAELKAIKEVFISKIDIVTRTTIEFSKGSAQTVGGTR